MIWEYVGLWLRRQKGDRAKKALFFWDQAHHFFKASEVLPIESKPLTSYYCCLNAAKALLAIRGSSSISLDGIVHGIQREKTLNWSSIKDAKVIFKENGVLCELSKYFEEDYTKKTYSIYDLLYNIPVVHRAFSITFNCVELFVPISSPEIWNDPSLGMGWGEFLLEERYSNKKLIKSIPASYMVIGNESGKYRMKCQHSFDWKTRGMTKAKKLSNLSDYHKKLRRDIFYIFGDTKLWYIKKTLPSNSSVLDRHSITLIYAVMHWLSELVRYFPERFSKLMHTKQNWVIREFIENALTQYIDEIACEITRTDIMVTGMRKA